MQINTHATIKSIKNNNATIATISTTASSHIGCSGNNASLSSRIIAAANCHHQQQPDVVPRTPSLTSYKHILATAVPANIQASAFTTSLPPPQLSSLSTSSSSKPSLPSTKAKTSSLLSIPQQSELFSLMEQQFLPNMITNDNDINSINDRNSYPNLNVFLDLETRQVLVPSTSNDGNMVLVPMQIPFQNSALRLALATSDSTVSDASCLNSPCSLASTKASTTSKPITTSSSPSYITTNDSNSIDNVVAGDSVNINDINKLTTTIGTVDNINLGNSGCKTKTLAQIKRQIADKRQKKKCLARAANSTASNYLSDHNSSGTNLNNLIEVQDHYLDVRELNNASSSISELDPLESTKDLLGSVICNSTVDSSTLSSSYLPVYRSNNILHDSLYHQFKGEHGNDKSLSSFKVDNVAITNYDINNNSDSGKRIDDIQFIASSNKHCECDSLSQENSFTSVVDNQINSRNIALSQDSIFVKTSTGCTSSSGINTHATISKCSAQQYIQNLLTVDRGCTITKEYSNNNANKGSKKKQKKKSCSKRQASASIDLNNIATNISYSDVDTTQSINKPIFYRIPIPSSSTTNVSTVSRTTTLYDTGKIGSLHSSMSSPLSYKPVMSNASISANEARTHSPQDSKLNLLLPSSVNTVYLTNEMLSPQFQTQHYEQQLQFDNLRYHQNPNPYFFSQLQNQYNYHHINQNKNDDVGDNSSGDLCVSDDTYFEPIVTTDNISNNSSNTIKKNRHFTALSAAVSTPSIAATVANKIKKESEDDDYAIKQLASSLHMEDSSPSMPSDFSIEHINKSSSGTITASAADTANLIMNGVTTASVEVACKNGSSENCGIDVSDRAIDNTTYFNSGNCYLSNNNCGSGRDCSHFLDEINLKTTRLVMNSTRRQLRLQSQNRHHHPQNDTRQHNLQKRKQATVHASSNFVSSNRVLPSSSLASKSSHISSLLLSPPLLSATTSMIVPNCLQQNNQNRYKNLLLKDNNKSMHTMDSKITTSCQSSMDSNLYTTANTVADAANINLGTISYNHNNNKNTRDLLLSSSSPVTSVAAAVVSTRKTKIKTSSPLLLYHDDPSNSMILSDEYFTTNPDGINISDDGDIGGNGFCGFTGNMIKKKRRCSPNSAMVDQQQQQMQQMYHRRHGVLASNMVSTSIELIPRYTANCSPVISTQNQNDSATSTAVNATDFITNNNNSHDNNSSVCDDGYGDDCGGGNIADGCFTTSNKTKDDPFSEIYGNSNNPKECRCRLRAMVMCLRCGSLCHSDCISTDSLCSDCVDKICVVVVRSEYES